jgi:hypothetical protein
MGSGSLEIQPSEFGGQFVKWGVDTQDDSL